MKNSSMVGIGILMVGVALYFMNKDKAWYKVGDKLKIKTDPREPPEIFTVMEVTDTSYLIDSNQTQPFYLSRQEIEDTTWWVRA